LRPTAAGLVIADAGSHLHRDRRIMGCGLAVLKQEAR
jgi:hypothetical protein